MERFSRRHSSVGGCVGRTDRMLFECRVFSL